MSENPASTEKQKPSNVGKLEEQALKRKERLKNLKRKFDSSDNSTKPAAEELPKPVFRNYKPETEENSENVVEQASKILPSVPDAVEEQLNAMKVPLEINDIDISNLAPRKVDWDLKRDISKKLEKLERRTQRAIVELIRDRLSSKDELLQAVNIGAEMNQKGAEVDESAD